MNILLTNDDGIHAQGLSALCNALQDLGNIEIFAPEKVQSATSHSITYTSPLMIKEVCLADGILGTSIDGRPADCVKLALRELWQEKYGNGTMPDLTISGMNSGANVGVNIIYSGTVAAAIESAFLGIPAIAVSLHINQPHKTCYEYAATIARRAIDRVLQKPINPHEVININIPVCESEDMEMPLMKVAGMNCGAHSGNYDKRQSPDGRTYYWAADTGMKFIRTLEGSDVDLLREGYITVTPLSYLLTDSSRLSFWKETLES